MRSTPLLTTRREFSLRARLLVAVLALIQFIAPTWHVCEMGGASCCPPKTGETSLHCARPGTGNTSVKPHCEKCPRVAKASAQTVSATPAAHGENCLAKLLMGMPLQSAAPIALMEFSSRQIAGSPTTPQAPSIGDLPQQPSRAPPRISL